MCKKVDKKSGGDEQQGQILQQVVGALMGEIQQMKAQQAGMQQGMQASMMQGRMGMGMPMGGQMQMNAMQLGAGGLSVSQMNMSVGGGFPSMGGSGYFASSFQSFGSGASMFGGVSAGFSATAISRSLFY